MADAQIATTVGKRLEDLPGRLIAQEDFGRVLAALNKSSQAALEGVWGSSCALVASALAQKVPATLLVVCPTQDDIDEFFDDIELFTSASKERFPAWESEPDEHLLLDETYGQRMRTLKKLSEKEPPKIVVAGIQSLLQGVPAQEEILENSRRLLVGDSLDLDSMLAWLVNHGFHNTSAVELPGEFTSRGGILDIFAPDWLHPIRMELFGDEIESIRQFSVATQRSLAALEQIEVTVLAGVSETNEHLTSYLPKGSWCLLVEQEQLIEQGQQFLRRLDRPRNLHSTISTMKELGQLPCAFASGIAQGSLGATCHLHYQSIERFSGDLASIRQEMDQTAESEEVVVVCQTEAESHRLQEILAETELFQSGRLQFVLGYLRSGFRITSEQLILISSSELFQRDTVRRRARRPAGKAIDSFLDLREGDLIVHLAHGIGRYRGLKLLEKEEQVEEHLEIEFHGGTRIYVPATKIDMVQKYVGGRKSRPTLAKIGGKSWLKQKEAAENAASDLAAEMLDVQAARSARPGIAFGVDTEWQQEFDASFPYHETPDQLAAIESIKADMKRPRPMDRLLCGDVGFGKTELSIRAAFKAVDNGYQVAVLVPTTILAEQHYRTFKERISEFPFKIAKLSRFCTPQEQRETIAGLKSGKVDIVVGTHRLASRDVSFENLGLVIIDEEQRFGVNVKERLKTLRSTVDILTMTATPIPRTLHMSLVGVRDISNLQTAPEDRLAVETRVTRFNAETIRHAVMRELSRGGQIYFVHNRVNDIENIAHRLKQIVPEAGLRIGHGQMDEKDLEKVMVDFVAGKFDLLLATTIVESGLDIPNANTIFIDQADRYGLADLHQLRGRVGRYKHRAYCYLLLDQHKHISPNAARRLRAIEEFSDMGAGFAIAMRDLEIRGAGNLLGTQQSGHIALIGYELYCRLLETAVRKLKKLPPKMVVDVTIDLPGEAYFPRSYVDDMRTKIDLYRRLGRVVNDEELNAVREELIDRFGAFPPPVNRLLDLSELKIDAAVWQITVIRTEDDYLVFEYTNRQRIEQLARTTGKKLRVVDEQSAYLPLGNDIKDPEAVLTALKSVLRSK